MWTYVESTNRSCSKAEKLYPSSGTDKVNI